MWWSIILRRGGPGAVHLGKRGGRATGTVIPRLLARLRRRGHVRSLILPRARVIRSGGRPCECGGWLMKTSNRSFPTVERSVILCRFLRRFPARRLRLVFRYPRDGPWVGTIRVG